MNILDDYLMYLQGPVISGAVRSLPDAEQHQPGEVREVEIRVRVRAELHEHWHGKNRHRFWVADSARVAEFVDVGPVE